MAEDNKYSGFFASRGGAAKDASEEIPAEKPSGMDSIKEEQVVEGVPSPSVEPVRGRGRPKSKSSNPEYQSTTLILRKTTKRKAAHLLEDREMGKDLSELVEELLTEWLAKQA